MPSQADTAPGTRATSAEQVMDGIREAIRIGRFAPGHRLTEVELTKEYGVSRGPVREALGRLETEGLIEITRHRGATVRRMTRADVEDLFAAREILEGGAARLAAARIAVDDHRARLEAQLAESDRWAGAMDGRGYADANEAFHAVIMSIADNRLVAELAGHLQTQTQRILYLQFMSLERVRISSEQHREIASAILAGDESAAELAMRRHIGDTAAAVLEASHPWFR